MSDDLGNAQVDFVWGGTLPPQPNDERHGWVVEPGNGEAEFYTKGHAKATDWGSNGNVDPYFPQDYLFPSETLSAVDSHVNALRYRDGYPADSNDYGFPNDYSDQPNIYGKTVAEALAQLAEIGVDPAILKDLTFSGGSGPYDWQGGEPNDDGVVVWRYLAPNNIIGYHWDGTPWLAREAEGLVQYTWGWPGGSIRTTRRSQCVFVAIQTTDPNKDTWSWWN
jgi:hypothetical protein